MKIKELIQESIQNFLNEDPDRIFPDDGDAPLSYDDDGAFAFSYDDYDNLMISCEGGTHGDLQSPETGQDYYRESATNSGRIWTFDKMISFWEYPAPKEILNILRDLEGELNIKILNDPDYRIETLVDMVGEPVNYDIAGHWTSDSDQKFLTPQEYSQLHDDQIQQRSPEELAKGHKKSPLLKPHKKPIKGSGSSKYGTQKPLAFRQALVRSESDNIFEQVEKILKEWTEDTMYDIFEMRDEIMRDTLYEFMEKPIGTRQPWKLVPFGRLKKIWEDAYKTGVVRDEKGLDMIQARMIRNLLKLDVNTEIMGHTQYYPREEIENLGYSMEQFEEKLEDVNDVYFNDDGGQFRISDYGLKPLWKIAQKLVGEEDDARRIMYIDQMLNVIHMRSDMAANFVEGGSAALSQISGEHAELGEGLNEKLEGEYTGRWYDKEPIEIYSNPKSIKRMDRGIRGIVDNDGNLYVANIGESGQKEDKVYAATTHSEIMEFLKNKGIIKYDKHVDDNGVVLNVGVHRHENTNDFYLGESNSFSILNNPKIYEQVEKIFEIAKQKNPSVNFLMHDIWGE